LFCLAGFTPACFANVSLSVNPIDGSNSLRFESVASGSLGNKKEIHIRVNSTSGSQYQVFQRIIDPIMDDKGDALNLQAIETQTQANSNSYGTLYLQNSDHLNMGDQLLYSSSQSGQSDSFIIGYSLNQNLMNASGSFRGRLVFTVRGLGNGAADQAVIDVFLDGTSSSLKISLKGGHEPNRVHVHSTDVTEKAADYVNVSFSGNSGQQIRIYQQVETAPQNETEQELQDGTLQLDAEGQTEGLRIAGLSSLVNSRTLVYSSNKTEDNFIVYFLVNADQIQQQDAGTYFGRIKYIVETDQGNQEIPIDIQCDVPPVFSINVIPPVGGVSFTHVLANNPPQDKEVMVTVLSNLHKPYQVLQDLQTNMTNKEGKEIDSKYFTIQVEIPIGQKGQTNLLEFTPVQTGEFPVFTSDSQGSGATFEVVYRLQGYAHMSPGDFLAPLRFSLNQK
jgi:hypothetical protein